MKHLIIILLSFCCAFLSSADNFVLTHGQSASLYVGRSEYTARAGQLLVQDYTSVFGATLNTVSEMAKARIIACTYDDAELQRYARLRHISFDRLKVHQGAFILKVHDNGRQLFVVGSDDQGTAFGLMTLSRQWGVSPFVWIDDALPMPRDSYQLGVAYEQLFDASIPRRTLILNGVQRQNPYLIDVMLRLRATGITNTVNATPVESGGIFRWSLEPSVQPYLGFQLQLQHPEHLRIEALRAVQHQLTDEWQLQLDHQICGELQTLLFFDMAWDFKPYRDDSFAVEQLMDQHYTAMAGFEMGWSRLMIDFYDLVFLACPDQPNSLGSLRRSIGESQQLTFQLAMDMSGRALAADYAGAFFRNVEYPLHMATTQIQRLCNMQLDDHGVGNSWSAEDCRQRMELLSGQLVNLTTPKWRQLMEGLSFPGIVIGQSMMRRDGPRLTQLEVGSSAELPSDVGTEILYRSPRAVGTQVVPFEPLCLPLEYHADCLHLRLSFLPTRGYERRMSVMVAVDGGTPQLVTLQPDAYSGNNQEFYDLSFSVDPQVEKHSITLRTQSDGIYLQRVWLCDMQM